MLVSQHHLVAIDKKLPLGTRYAYMVSVVNKDGLELKSGVTIEP